MALQDPPCPDGRLSARPDASAQLHRSLQPPTRTLSLQSSQRLWCWQDCSDCRWGVEAEHGGSVLLCLGSLLLLLLRHSGFAASSGRCDEEEQRCDRIAVLLRLVVGLRLRRLVVGGSSSLSFPSSPSGRRRRRSQRRRSPWRRSCLSASPKCSTYAACSPQAPQRPVVATAAVRAAVCASVRPCTLRSPCGAVRCR